MTFEGTQQVQTGEAGGNSSPALDALMRKETDPTLQTPQQQTPIKQRDGVELFNQLDKAIEPGLFDGDTGLQNIQSSNDPADVQPQQVIDPNQPLQDLSTQLPDTLDTQMRKQVINQPLIDPNVPKVIDPNLQRQPGQQDIVQRYSESSREAKRLASENKTLQERLDSISPVMPLVMKLKESSQLRDLVKGYYSEGGTMPVDLKKQLNLPEDFVFDGNEAFDNPQSDSAKLLSSTMDMYAFRRTEQMRNELKKEIELEKAKSQKQIEFNAFRVKNNINDEQMGQINEFMKTHQISYDDVVYLMNRDFREKNVAEHAVQDSLNQMKAVQELPTSISGQTTQPIDINSEDARFDLAFPNLQKDDGGIFGGKDS